MRFSFVYDPDDFSSWLNYEKPSTLQYGNFPRPPDPPGYNINYRMDAYGGMYTEMRCNRCHCLWQSGHMCASSVPTNAEHR